VNNTEYVRWALDAVHQHLGNLPEIRTVQFTYMAEVFAGNEIETLVRVDANGPLSVCIRKQGDGSITNAFVLEICQ
jgi:acyl-ACP thioesterase